MARKSHVGAQKSGVRIADTWGIPHDPRHDRLDPAKFGPSVQHGRNSGKLDYNSRVRQLWRALHSVPQLLLVQPEQLSYDLAYSLALLPLLLVGIIYFLQDAILLFAISFLAGIVCLLAIQLARLTFGLPAWVGFKAMHPLVASVVIACFFS